MTWVRSEVGAVATQSWVNPYLGIDGITLLDRGYLPDKALDAVLLMDPQPELRQVGLVDGLGRAAAYTGQDCEGYAGHRTGEGWSVQGNLLHGAQTIEACVDAFLERPDADLVDRLIASLEAGEQQGGDRRGSRSAAVYVVGEQEFPLWDLRVDDDEQPLPALRRLQDAFAQTLLPQIHRLPRRDQTQQRQGGDEEGLV